MPDKTPPEEVAVYLGGPVEFVSPFWTEPEILAAIAESRLWLHGDDCVFVGEARYQMASQLQNARDCLRVVRARKTARPIPTELLTNFTSRFLGYGNPNAPLWFVGMEEGVGSGLDELSRRLTAWDTGERKPFEDLPSYHHRIGLAKNFLPPFPLQRTWAPLIRCLLAFRGEAAPPPARIRAVQANGLGTQHGDTVLAELLPMPSPGVGHWPYAALAELIPHLKDRKTYADALRQPRVELLRAAIHAGKPKAVVFYGLGYIDAWNAIAGVTLQTMVVAGRSMFAATRDSVKYYAVPHPVAHGMTHAFWTEIGGIMR